MIHGYCPPCSPGDAMLPWHVFTVSRAQGPPGSQSRWLTDSRHHLTPRQKHLPTARAACPARCLPPCTRTPPPARPGLWRQQAPARHLADLPDGLGRSQMRHQLHPCPQPHSPKWDSLQDSRLAVSKSLVKKSQGQLPMMALGGTVLQTRRAIISFSNHMMRSDFTYGWRTQTSETCLGSQ